MFTFHFDPDAWKPELPGVESRSWTYTSRLEPGMLVIWNRKPYRVLELRERAQANWPEAYVTAWVEAGMPDPETWDNRPRVIVLRSEEEPDAKAQNIQWKNSGRWHKLPEHYPICRLCKEIPPCRHVHNERIMERAGERLAEEMAILPGVCHGCREPITKRQKSFTFPGANLIRPDLGDDSAIFHTRRDCYGSLDSYDRRWAKAEPGRERLLYCEGTVTEHHDDSRECSNVPCVAAKVEDRSLVQHAMWIRHHPQMEEARGCWCLAGVLF